MKTITTQQIEAIINVIYSTNIPASQFDAIRKLLSELPDVKEEKPKTK
jgi:hypothetical protein